MSDLRDSLTQSGTLYGFINTIVYAHDYNDLSNKPQINGVTLQNNKTASELGLVTPDTEAVQSVNGETGAVVLDGNDIAYDNNNTINQQIDAVAASIPVMAVTSVNGETGDVVLDGSDIRYDADYTVSAKIAAVEAAIPVVSYPVTSVNSKTGAVVLDDTDIEHSSGVSVNSLINTIMNYTPVYGNTASGAIATFDTSLALPLQDCTIEINAVQEGSGTPSPDNVRPISGWTGMTLQRTRKNILPMPITSGSYGNTVTVLVNEDKSFYISKTSNSGWTLFLLFSGTLPAGTYTVIEDDDSSANASISVRYFGTTTELTNTRYTKNKTFTLNVATAVDIFYARSAIADNVLTKVMLFSGIGYTATDYEPHSGQTYSVDWTSEAGTVYGGTLDVTTGVLTVTHARVDLGSLTQWNKNTSFTNTLFVANVSDKKTNNSNCICTNYTNGGIATGETFLNNMQNNNFASDTSNGIYIRDDSKASLSGDDFKTAMSGVYLVYELATPVTYQLTPTQISAIVGTNNIFCDTGDTSVVYACSLKDYIDSQ